MTLFSGFKEFLKKEPMTIYVVVPRNWNLLDSNQLNVSEELAKFDLTLYAKNSINKSNNTVAFLDRNQAEKYLTQEGGGYDASMVLEVKVPYSKRSSFKLGEKTGKVTSEAKSEHLEKPWIASLLYKSSNNNLQQIFKPGDEPTGTGSRVSVVRHGRGN